MLQTAGPRSLFPSAPHTRGLQGGSQEPWAGPAEASAGQPSRGLGTGGPGVVGLDSLPCVGTALLGAPWADTRGEPITLPHKTHLLCDRTWPVRGCETQGPAGRAHEGRGWGQGAGAATSLAPRAVPGPAWSWRASAAELWLQQARPMAPRMHPRPPPPPPAAPGEACPPGRAARMERKPIRRQPLRQCLVFLSQGRGPPGAAPRCPHPTHVVGVTCCRCPPPGRPLTTPAAGTPA